ncbi:MAG TPA: P-loop NTPase, partial [Pirellulaceae bacterium]
MIDGIIRLDEIREELARFPDPETGRNVIQLEQVRDIRLDGDGLRVELGLTRHSAILKDDVRMDLEQRLRAAFPQLTAIEVAIVPHERIVEPIGEIGLRSKSVVLVGSGKGGVGKSTIAAAIACGLHRAGSRVGLMDADVYGPSIPHLLGISGRP